MMPSSTKTNAARRNASPGFECLTVRSNACHLPRSEGMKDALGDELRWWPVHSGRDRQLHWQQGQNTL